jgi:hypothetical protein
MGKGEIRYDRSKEMNRKTNRDPTTLATLRVESLPRLPTKNAQNQSRLRVLGGRLNRV